MQEYIIYTPEYRHYLELHSAIECARAEGRKEGIAEVLSIVKYYIEGLSLPEIALRVDKTTEFIAEFIENTGLNDKIER